MSEPHAASQAPVPGLLARHQGSAATLIVRGFEQSSLVLVGILETSCAPSLLTALSFVSVP